MAKRHWFTTVIRDLKIEVEYEIEGSYEEDTNAGPVAFVASAHDAESGEDFPLTDDERELIENNIAATHEEDYQDD